VGEHRRRCAYGAPAHAAGRRRARSGGLHPASRARALVHDAVGPRATRCGQPDVADVGLFSLARDAAGASCRCPPPDAAPRPDARPLESDHVRLRHRIRVHPWVAGGLHSERATGVRQRLWPRQAVPVRFRQRRLCDCALIIHQLATGPASRHAHGRRRRRGGQRRPAAAHRGRLRHDEDRPLAGSGRRRDGYLRCRAPGPA